MTSAAVRRGSSFCSGDNQVRIVRKFNELTTSAPYAELNATGGGGGVWRTERGAGRMSSVEGNEKGEKGRVSIL